MLGLHFCTRALSSCGKRGPPLIAVRGPLPAAASLVAEHRPQTHRLSSCGPRAQSLRGMWDPPGPGLEPVSPALAGGLSTTAPPGKPCASFLMTQSTATFLHSKSFHCFSNALIRYLWILLTEFLPHLLVLTNADTSLKILSPCNFLESMSFCLFGLIYS